MPRSRSSGREETGLGLAAAAVAAACRRIAHHRKAAARGDDPEDLHQVRVGLRRMRAAVRTFGPILELPRVIRPSAVAKAARELGSGRDLDVLMPLLARLAADLSPQSRVVADDLSERLARRRRRAEGPVGAALDGRRLRTLLNTAEAWAAEPRGSAMADRPVADLLPDLASPAISAVLLHEGWLAGMTIVEGRPHSSGVPGGPALREMLDRDGRTLHDLRRVIRDLRYQSDTLLAWLPDGAAHLGQLRKGQDILGDLHDLHGLCRALSAHTPVWQTRARELDRRIAAAERQAWRAWLPLRRPLLTAAGRAAMRRALGAAG